MRSLLFVPGDSPRKFEKALASEADALILDLEDSVSLSQKEPARAMVAQMLQAPRGGKSMIVRVNALDTGLTAADLAGVMAARPDAVLLPKSLGASSIAELSHYLTALEAAHGIPEGQTRIYAVATETAGAVMGLASYAPAHPRLAGLMWGAEDLCASLGALSNRDGASYSGPFLLARNLCLMAAASAGVAAIDTVCTVIGDLEYVEDEAAAARRDGFEMKAVIHPAHIAPVNRAFTPSEAEVAHARELVALFAANPELGVVQLDGRMIDKPHERAARRILAAAGLAAD